jgi:enediyne biosynthesis protein E4
LSCEGPKLSQGDLNGDGMNDLFIGGPKDQAGTMFFQTLKDGFEKTNEKLLSKDKISEDMGSAIFDCDGDGDMDIYVCSGGNEFPTSSSALSDRLYINDGRGIFSKFGKLFPTNKFESSSVARAADYDNDGDQDLFVGIRLQPFSYGLPVNGYLLRNDGEGNFEEVSGTVCPEFSKLGMITDARWVDIDNDKDQDLVVVGEWMPIKIFINQKGILRDNSKSYGMDNTSGWWNTIEVADLNGDGFMDLVVGNHGLNSRFEGTITRPLSMYVNDFDRNGSIEQIICAYNGDKSFPMVLRHDLLSQIPSLKKKYLKYDDYKDQTISDIFVPEQLTNSILLQAVEMETSLFLNDRGEKLKKGSLPIQVQYTPIYAVQVFDFDGDAKLDIVMGGNLYRVKPEVGRYDASYGVFLKGDGKGAFVNFTSKESGLFIDGEVRDFEIMKIGSVKYLLVAKNNEKLQWIKLK